MLDINKNFTVNKNTKDESREQQAIKVRIKRNDDDDIVREFLQIDHLQDQFQKLKDQPHNSAETPNISFGVNQDCYEQNLNESVVNRTVYPSSSNVYDKTSKM